MIYLNTSYAILLTFLSGSATLLGIIPIYIKINKEKLINITLSFTSGVLLSTSLFELLRESFTLFNKDFKKIPSIIFLLIFLNIGIIIANTISKKINKKINNSLYKTGIIDVITIILHNIPEGIITFLSATANIKLGITLAITIILHNIPEGISIAVPIYYGTKKKKAAFFYTFIASLSEPLGGILAYIFLKDLINNFILGIMLSGVCAIMINISLTETLPSALKYKNLKLTTISFLLGLILMLII